MNPSCAPLDAFYEAILFINHDGFIRACNQRALTLFHASTERPLVGRNLTTLFAHPQQGLDLLSQLTTSLTTQEAFTLVEARLARDDGRSLMVEIAIRQYTEDQFTVSMRDITQRHQALRDLEDANERLRATDRDRIAFVSNVSHELRSPLTSMSYALTNMQRGICGQLPEKALAYIERLQTDVKRLLLTVNDILDMRQIETGTLNLHKTTASLKKHLLETIESLQLQAEAKQQALHVSTCEGDAFAMVDTYKIERIFSNIIANAIKYTPAKGTISITLQSVAPMARIIVDDTGIGIPPEALPRVTQPYYRVGDHVAGTGLGLSIVKELITLHDGTLHIESPVPGTTIGTRVTLEIPLSERPLWVLLSGDDAFINEMTPLIQRLGCIAIPDQEALHIHQRYISVSPARFIIDGALPEYAIEDILYQIHGSPRLTKTPILILVPNDCDSLHHYAYAHMNVVLRPYPTTLDVLRQL